MCSLSSSLALENAVSILSSSVPLYQSNVSIVSGDISLSVKSPLVGSFLNSSAAPTIIISATEPNLPASAYSFHEVLPFFSQSLLEALNRLQEALNVQNKHQNNTC
mmetsp:Transcript_18370/g.52999  ORF Transcript_18370/g.52999 Transcript_18370/m.52999 type:complete len:106 (+) Transcript_18370:700-1017(+)